MSYFLIRRISGKSEIIEADAKDIPFGARSGEEDWIQSRSSGHETEAELRRATGIPDEPCRICNQVFTTSYIPEVKKVLIERNICHSCYHWSEQSQMVGRKRIIVNGTKYAVADEAIGSTSIFKGHGGRKFKIQIIETGEIIITDNLWCQGDIPNHFRDIMPDNAVFLKST